ncbi:fumarylacetoacetate hydrolase family protein [Geobacillus subterraneus]|uniref:fumarylacetoacetate hydrolase family protein n=1 Tax=Geobacillus subterraneus TaxID=129338 RepID=UPI001442C8C1|nr:fumarylacetoacetate hydrolase family protein [Geobacillus subterraneus]QIZ67614.1 fumarylacetoacetate hydrolase family protein [Geobacillus subterraneus]WPZ19806.1 fumarylacetoacetate hydrolase family protein [Geobacillus subterraneus]
MKFARFIAEGAIRAGVVSGEVIREIEGDMFAAWDYTGNVFRCDGVSFVAPLVPRHVIGIGANYVAAREQLPAELPDIPVFFFKPSSSVIGPEADIVIPNGISEVKFESELAVVIGKEAKQVSEDDVWAYIFGYTVANDVTAPQFFHSDGHWTVGKSFDTFTPLGPVIETELDPRSVAVKARVNGEEKQNSPTELMIISISKMISYLSYVMTLQPGDVILTGSPVGAEFVGPGTVIECEVDGIGTLRNTFVAAKAPAVSTQQR